MSPVVELWDSITKDGLDLYEKRLEQARSSTLVVSGSYGSGKTTLINNYLEREEEPKPSLPVEFTYARRTNNFKHKDVSFIWEIGGLSNLTYVEDLVESERILSVSVLVVIDLSNINHLWYICNTIASFDETKRKHLKVRYGFIGTKYDLFEQRFNLDKKMIICRVLKHYASVVGGPLVFCTKEDRATMKVAKDLFSHLTFGTKFNYQIKFDLSSPIIIPKGGENKSDMSYLIQNFEAQFGKLDMKITEKMPENTEDPNYANEVIDNRARRNMFVNDSALLD